MFCRQSLDAGTIEICFIFPQRKNFRIMVFIIDSIRLRAAVVVASTRLRTAAAVNLDRIRQIQAMVVKNVDEQR
jgi:hypothetical protein